MRPMALICALLVTTHLAACGSSSKEGRLTEAARPSLAGKLNYNLLSIDGELFPLSTYFGVCVRRVHVLRSTFDNGIPGPHFPTYAEITGTGGALKITVGKFDMYPGAVIKELPAISPHRRIRIGRDRFHSFVLVSDFGAGSNLVSINYDGVEAEAAAIHLANNVVACRVSAATSEINGYNKNQPVNQDLFSPDGDLFPLSAYFGVCARRPGVLRSTINSGPIGPQYPTVAEINGEAGLLTITVGKFDIKSEAVLKDISASSPSKRIRIGIRNGLKFILISDFDKASDNLVSISFDDAGSSIKEAARFAEKVVACHVSAVPFKANTGR